MLETKPFSLSKRDYFKIVCKTRFKKSWWIFLLLIIITMFYLKTFGEDNFSTFVVIFSFLYPLVVFIGLYFLVNSKKNDPIFSQTRLTFDNEFLYFFRNENETKLTPKSIQKVVSNKFHWLLYISKGQFIYLPKNIFYSDDEYLEFCKLINISN